MQSLTSKGFVKTQFSWQYYYYTLTSEGLLYLREWYVPSPLPPPILRCDIQGCIYPLKLFLELTKRLPVHRGQLMYVAVKVPTELRVATGMTIVVATTVVKRRAHLASIDLSLLVSVGVPHENKVIMPFTGIRRMKCCLHASTLACITSTSYAISQYKVILCYNFLSLQCAFLTSHVTMQSDYGNILLGYKPD